MNMNPNSNLPIIFFLFVLTLVRDNTDVHASSVSSLFLNFRKLERDKFGKVSPTGSPLPAPARAPAPAPARAPAPAPEPTDGGLVDENWCSNGCQDRNFTACLQISSADPKEAFLFVKNDEDGPRKVNVRVPHSKIIFPEIEMRQHEAQKIKVPAIVDGSLTIVVNAGNGDCVLYMQSSAFKKLFIFGTQGAPVYAAYLLFFTVVVVGVTLACCCKSRKSRLQGNGIAYQELELGKPETVGAEDLEKQEGWEEDWDDEWDESKTVRSPVAHRRGNVSANGLDSRSNDKHKWEKKWND